MRGLKLLVVLASIGLLVSFSGQALALPNADAEQAYANGDYRTAFMLWLPLAEQGSPTAQMNVARMYEKGEYVAQDSAMAAEWYRKAAEQSQRDAANAPATSQAMLPQVVGPQPTPQQTPQQTVVAQPAPVYSQPAVSQPVYYPVVRRAPPIFVPSHHHWRR